jgi:hypothetical protein
MAILPATGSAMTFGRIRKGHENVSSVTGHNVALRGTLGAYYGITTGAVSVSSLFGGRTTPYNDT